MKVLDGKVAAEHRLDLRCRLVQHLCLLAQPKTAPQCLHRDDPLCVGGEGCHGLAAPHDALDGDSRGLLRGKGALRLRRSPPRHDARCRLYLRRLPLHRQMLPHSTRLQIPLQRTTYKFESPCLALFHPHDRITNAGHHLDLVRFARGVRVLVRLLLHPVVLRRVLLPLGVALHVAPVVGDDPGLAGGRLGELLVVGDEAHSAPELLDGRGERPERVAVEVVGGLI